MEKEIKIDQYSKKEATIKSKTTTLIEIFDRISNSNIDKPKTRRAGNVFACRSKKGRKHDDIVDFTGLMFIDLDNCSDHIKVKELFISIENTVAVWYSSSGKNVHGLIKIPICVSVEEYKSRFKAFKLVIDPYISELGKLDKITSNPTQLAFESYDPEIFINEKPLQYNGIKKAPEKGISIDYTTNLLPSVGAETWVINKLTKKFKDITSNGYPQVRDFSIWCGGLIGGGYINDNLAKEIVINLINCNPYLNSSISSGSLRNYKKVALWGIEEGIKKPIFWRR